MGHDLNFWGMIIKRNCSFKLRAYGKDKDIFQIRLRVTFNCQRVDFTTGCQLTDSKYWDDVQELVKDGYVGPKGEDTFSINNELRNYKGQVETAFKYFEAIDKFPTMDELSDKYKERITGTVPKKPEPQKRMRNNEPKFFDTFDLFMRDCGVKNAWSLTTYQKFNALKKDLKTFKKNLKFSDMTESTLTAFVCYLRDEKALKTPRRAKGDREDYDEDDVTGLKNSTIEKKLKYIRWFMNWATDKGYNTNMAYKTYKATLKQTQKKIIYLSKEELAAVRSLELSPDQGMLSHVRDIFLFCCFSGLRQSDAYNLRRSDIKNGFIEVTTVKTADSITVELNKVTKGILDKYKDCVFYDGRALPPISNQQMNKALKELCEMAGIDEEIRITSYKGNERIDEIYKKWELIGTHTGRRTFIVNALSMGIPPNVVMKWTGHSDYKSMKPYIDIVDSIKAESMTKFDSLL